MRDSHMSPVHIYWVKLDSGLTEMEIPDERDDPVW
jgi:hypothetical protein